MPMRTSLRTRRPAPTQRRRRVWARDQDASTEAAGSVHAFQPLLTFQTALGSDLLGCTVGRIRLTLGVRTLAGTANTGGGSFYGLLVGPDTLDVAADFGPRSFPHLDWMWWTFIPSPSGHQVGVAGEEPAFDTYFFDVKSMRKMEELGETLWFAKETTAVLGTAQTIEHSLGISTLLLLP